MQVSINWQGLDVSAYLDGGVIDPATLTIEILDLDEAIRRLVTEDDTPLDPAAAYAYDGADLYYRTSRVCSPKGCAGYRDLAARQLLALAKCYHADSIVDALQEASHGQIAVEGECEYLRRVGQ